MTLTNIILDLSHYSTSVSSSNYTLKLKKGRVATDLRHHFFTERIVNTWNHLDASVVEAETLTFKSRLQRMYDNDESFLGRTTSY